MGPLIRLVLILFALWLIIRYIKRALDTPSPRAPTPDTPEQVSAMLKCKQCGVYIPQSEATRRGGNVYCSRDHAEADNKT